MMILKVGGGADINLTGLARDLAEIDEPMVVVLGANALRDRIAADLGVEIRRLTSVSGYVSVYSDDDLLDLQMMAYAGPAAVRFTALLQREGVNAVSLSGVDGGVIRGRRNRGIRARVGGKKMLVRDRSGKPTSVNADLLHRLLDDGYLPVLTVPILDEEGVPINCENDDVTALLAETLGADTVVHLIEAPGLLANPRDPTSLLPVLSAEALRVREAEAEGRFRRKLRSLLGLVEIGVRIHIGDGRLDRPLHAVRAGLGTRIEARAFGRDSVGV